MKSVQRCSTSVCKKLVKPSANFFVVLLRGRVDYVHKLELAFHSIPTLGKYVISVKSSVSTNTDGKNRENVPCAVETQALQEWELGIL